MIRFIKGSLAEAKDGEIVVENNGIGYAISVPMSVIELLPSIGEELKVYTYFHVREDAMQLFGFLTQDDLEVFKLLITVNGIGPKVALGILGFMSAYDIRYAVMADDAKAIAKAPGIGPKTASKLILELKDKLTLEDMFGDIAESQDVLVEREDSVDKKEIVQDAIEALVVLGYPKTDAAKAVRSVELDKNMTVEELLKKSLKKL